jgi:hypothetical protein
MYDTADGIKCVAYPMLRRSFPSANLVEDMKSREYVSYSK